MTRDRPSVLCFSGHDPSGGAGIQADIETLISFSCHAASVITALTEQDSLNVKKIIPQRPEDIISQARTVLADFPVQAFKIGLIGHPETAKAIAGILQDHPHIPVVLDPVLAAGGGTELATEQLLDTIKTRLLPLTHILTPNSIEARRLSGAEDLTDAAMKLMKMGCKAVLITGTHENTDAVSNQLYQDGEMIKSFNCTRLPYSYHGSGCTLAAALAGLIAQGLKLPDAVSRAQDYTWNALHNAYRPGQGQHNPARLFWTTTSL
ncbi:MAG: bifunctional hydroxymethylpyrimidine kinase/phosphomethylpyrimidine kinase [Methylicorpusculum sp.]|uniref:bifunctional hydroxymethylpyrimidine kinase/phosphomethylpyrimidine kinase n=1 Tax=Methylicorpusculum sp. TaxID=2713644 RepID=UPI0027260C12|nr:bifunctional hydroxymethylpyrimidine kinase/phosphomethylpyrimidine kinase [Methylicorpusculum sp.]MDO8939396.1 bifunctional hydroxymethylpyrimidine kinase/phosphomethylpyrimidine kinase [Methylicorpusculum sp.]MDP2179884.1 bifunctional hydroxymethylpyrimidine kinase/phosphomethylpyrimidine kinase [Methylicorpusculum sp.]MDP2201795.1 bifunctional hydroxymethylpyrimidine kinase/phosphomethylpyrimidine kinase [Methylicorpusculum sp.]MDP3527691.1 bifunctional hydroxymethylpyrimidine kinase/phos